MSWRIRRFVAAASTAAGLSYLSDRGRRDSVVDAADGSARFLRVAWHGAAALIDFKATVESIPAGSVERDAAKLAWDARTANRMLNVCRKHGGLWTKLGQYISTLNYALPAPYTTTLAALQDRAPALPWADIASVVEAECGATVSEIFSEVDEAPVAAASLAQVHRAVLRSTGDEVAIKVQYPRLQKQLRGDVASLRFLLTMLEWFAPDLGYTWLVPEFAATLEHELNFLTEAATSRRVAAMFAAERDVHIPAVYSSLTTERLLVMEYIRGVKPTDTVALQELGIPRSKVATIVTRVFAEQVFVHGFVHADPHPGNLLVRAVNGEPQLVVLDHGMYRRLTPQFRAGYCRLWQALLTRDDVLGRTATLELGLPPGAFDTLSLILTYRPPNSSAALGSRLSTTDVKALESNYGGGAITSSDINRFLQRLPRDLLFVMRASNMVRALNRDCGGTARSRFRANGEAAIAGLILTDAVSDFSADAMDRGAADWKSSAGRAADSSGPVDVDDIAELRANVDAGAFGGTGAGSDSSDIHALARTIGAAVRRQAPAAPVEPLSFLNELSRSAHLDDPVDSELNVDSTRSWSRHARAQLAVLRVRLLLLQFDLLMALAQWSGSYVPHTGKRHRDREDPG